MKRAARRLVLPPQQLLLLSAPRATVSRRIKGARDERRATVTQRSSTFTVPSWRQSHIRRVVGFIRVTFFTLCAVKVKKLDGNRGRPFADFVSGVLDTTNRKTHRLFSWPFTSVRCSLDHVSSLSENAFSGVDVPIPSRCDYCSQETVRSRALSAAP